MSLSVSQRDFDQIADFLRSECGINLGPSKGYLIADRLSPLVTASGSGSFAEFSKRLVARRDPQLRDKVVDAMTTNETMWFRDGKPWIAFRDDILKDFEAQSQAGGAARFRIWSAACSTGQEPYSIAMLIDEFCSGSTALRPSSIEIVATDISPSALFAAKAGRYDAVNMRRGFTGEWEHFKSRYFEIDGRVGVIDPKIASRVKFSRLNLKASLAHLGKFDVVFIRNVLIYFSREFRTELLDRVAKTLKADGKLFVGSSESIRTVGRSFVRSPGQPYHQLADYGGGR